MAIDYNQIPGDDSNCEDSLERDLFDIIKEHDENIGQLPNLDFLDELSVDSNE